MSDFVELVRANTGMAPVEEKPTGADPTYNNELTLTTHKVSAVGISTFGLLTVSRYALRETAVVMPMLYSIASTVPAVLYVANPQLQAGAAGLTMAAICRLVDKGAWRACALYGGLCAASLYITTQVVMPWAKRVGHIPY